MCAGNTFGKAIAGILAHSKGRSIGIYEDKEKDEEAESNKAEEEQEKGVKKVDVFGMKVVGLMPGAWRFHVYLVRLFSRQLPQLDTFQDAPLALTCKIVAAQSSLDKIHIFTSPTFNMLGALVQPLECSRMFLRLGCLHENAKRPFLPL